MYFSMNFFHFLLYSSNLSVRGKGKRILIHSHDNIFLLLLSSLCILFCVSASIKEIESNDHSSLYYLNLNAKEVKSLHYIYKVSAKVPMPKCINVNSTKITHENYLHLKEPVVFVLY